jgi:hypothetical protein
VVDERYRNRLLFSEVTITSPASAFHIRETLDAAVRELSVNARPIQERVRASRTIILGRLSPSDFASPEDRELFNHIQAAFADTPSSDSDRPNAVCDQTSDATAEEIAADILDLRDTAMGRAIRNARVETHAKPHGRSRG